jgi:hypothetical protein
MSNFVYTITKSGLMNGTIDLDTQDIRAMLVMTNTTADTENTKTTISGFTTLDEMDGAGYSRQALTSEAVATDNTNDRGEFTAADITFSNVAAGTRDVAGCILYRFITTDADHIPIAWIDTAGSLAFPLTPNGGNIKIAANAQGLVQVG